MQITKAMRTKLITGNTLSLALIAFLWYLNRSTISSVVLFLILLLCNAVRIYSWSQM